MEMSGGWGEYHEAPWKRKSGGLGVKLEKTFHGGYENFLEPDNLHMVLSHKDPFSWHNLPQKFCMIFVFYHTLSEGL